MFTSQPFTLEHSLQIPESEPPARTKPQSLDTTITATHTKRLFLFQRSSNRGLSCFLGLTMPISSKSMQRKPGLCKYTTHFHRLEKRVRCSQQSHFLLLAYSLSLLNNPFHRKIHEFENLRKTDSAPNQVTSALQP